MSPRLRKSIDNLSLIDYSVPSKAEVALDRLASCLISEFQLDDSIFWGRAPSLREVIGMLSKKNIEFKNAASIMPHVEALMKEAYNDELEEGDSERLAEHLGNLQKILRKICN